MPQLRRLEALRRVQFDGNGESIQISAQDRFHCGPFKAAVAATEGRYGQRYDAPLFVVPR